jgi:hypothetical protein
MLCEDGKQRFPRLIKDFPKYALDALKHTKMERYRALILNGITPKGWRRLTRRQKQIARRIAAGFSIRDVCRKYKMDSNTFYHWLHCHPLFQKYYYRQAARNAGIVDKRLDASVHRAIRVVEESLNSGDPYFAHEAAVQFLKGRGKYKPQMTVDKRGSIQHQFSGTVNENVTIKDEKVVHLLVEAMHKMAGGGTQEERPKIIDAEVVKELPPAPMTVSDEPKEIQEREQKQAVGRNKQSKRN